MNKLLARQLRRSFGSLDNVPEDLNGFLKVVNDTYDHHDQDRLLVERSLEISSEELSALNAEMRSIFREFPDIFFRLNSEGLILDYLSRKHDMLFNKGESLTGKYIQHVPDPEIGNLFKTSIELVNSEKSVESIEYSMEFNGVLYFFEANLIPLFEDNIIVFIRDITERKLTEDKLKKVTDQAIESDRLKSAFLANMSHEIRSPMNSILGFAELLEDGSLSQQERTQYSQIIQKSGNHLLNLISDIIDISKIESGQLTLNYESCMVNHLLSEVYDLFFVKKELYSKSVNLLLKCGLSDQESHILTDPLRLKQVMINLISNAVKFTDQGSIEFGYNLVQQDNEEIIRFFVIDTGRGISEENQGIIFQRFTQDNTDPRVVNEGTGLGLPISKEIIQKLGGEIWFSSELGVGTQFYFTLPYVLHVDDLNM